MSRCGGRRSSGHENRDQRTRYGGPVTRAPVAPNRPRADIDRAGAGFISLPRDDLAATIYAMIENDVETVFGDFIRDR